MTCNYEARRRGLYKLQLVKDAKRTCPEVIIELGEDISRFRDASKELYSFLKAYTWNGKVERLGFDEVWMDVTDMIDYNMDVMNKHGLEHSFFHLAKDDPTEGFSFDATCIAGLAYPNDYHYQEDAELDDLTLRLRLGSHLALYMRHQLEQQKGYTSTVGIATNKLLAKLVGNLNKPKGQTTVMPPLVDISDVASHATSFMDGHDIGKVPGIGFKLAQKIREHCLHRPANFDHGLVYGGTKEKVTVADVRKDKSVEPEMLEKLLAGPGSPHGIGYKVWCLLHGVDDSEVKQAKPVPSQISIEDSYIRLDTMPELLKELSMLSRSLLTRIRIDLLGEEDDFDDSNDEQERDANKAISVSGKKWLAHPKTLRLTTRPRQPLQPDGTRVRSFKRISHSGPLPTFVFNLSISVDILAEKLVQETLIGMFRKLHPEKAGWNLSLVNLAVTNMAETAGESKTANGRDISNMFKRQDVVLKDFRVTDSGELECDRSADATEDGSPVPHAFETEGKDQQSPQPHVQAFDIDNAWDDDETMTDLEEACSICGARLPEFAMIAHRRYHSNGMK